MSKLNPMKAGIAFGIFMAAIHAAWAALVAAGWAMSVLDFLLRLHFVHMTYGIGPFNAGTAIELVAVASFTGCAAGYLFACFWNWVNH